MTVIAITTITPIRIRNLGIFTNNITLTAPKMKSLVLEVDKPRGVILMSKGRKYLIPWANISSLEYEDD